MCKIPEMVTKAKTLGMDALALTDHGNINGAIHFYKECQKQGIRPILGIESYLVEDVAEYREAKFRKAYHLTIFAENNIGWRNLIKLVTKSNSDSNFYYQPRIDFKELEAHKEGLIILSGCMNGIISSHLYDHLDKSGNISQPKNILKAEAFVRRFLKIFDNKHFYLEVQDNGIPEQLEINKELRKIAAKYTLETVATIDAHYVNKDDSQAHTTFKCIGYHDGKAGYSTDEFYLKGYDDLVKLDFTEREKLLTSEIAARCNVVIDLKKKRLPSYQFVPVGYDSKSYLRKLVDDGLNKLNLSGNKVYADRVAKELADIELMGFSDYFLIVQDVLNWTKSQNILCGPGRGSAGGSLVSYLIGITGIDPIKYHLIWERFLNIGRIGLPDIDSDVPRSKRNLVLNYIRERFGRNNTAQLATYNKLAARAVLKDVFRVFEMPFEEANEITGLIPLKNDDHGQIDLDDAINKTPKLQEYERKHKAWFSIARKLEGCYKSLGTHASAVVIADQPFNDGEYPLSRSADSESLVFAWDMQSVDDLKLLKLDILGLSTLDIIHNTFDIIRSTRNISLSLDDIPLDDAGIFQIFEEGKTTSIFQLETQLGKTWSKAIKPKKLSEISDLIALIRPACLDGKLTEEYKLIKNGEKLPSYIIPELEPILRDTYSILVYQEQMLEICKQIAGMTLQEADDMRRVAAKKKPDELKAKETEFIQGCLKKGFSLETADKLWEWIKYQAGYSFNASHSLGYALLSYYTAYLKVYYPTAFLCANFINAAYAQDSFAEINKLVNDAKLFGIKIIPPKLGAGNTDFAVIDEKTIAFGLSALKGVGEKGLAKLLAVAKGVKDFDQLLQLIFAHKITRKVVEALIKSGALDDFQISRVQMMARYDLFDSLTDKERSFLFSNNYSSWFSTLKQMCDEEKCVDLKSQTKIPNSRRRETLRTLLSEFDRTKPFDGFIEKLTWEKFYLGIAVTGNEADMFKSKTKCSDILNYGGEGWDVELAVKLENIREIRTHKGKGDLMAFLTGSDNTGQIDNIVVFPRSYARYKHTLEKDKVVRLYGAIDAKHSLIVERIERLS